MPALDSQSADGDAIADCILDAFDALPRTCRPRGPATGLGPRRREWTPLAGVVIER